MILPGLHFGRDAPLAAALVLDLLARGRDTVSGRVASRPRYAIVKAKAPRGGDLKEAYANLVARFSDAALDRQDGLRLAWSDRWLHVRPSGTEPIVRLIAEAPDREGADALVTEAQEALEASVA